MNFNTYLIFAYVFNIFLLGVLNFISLKLEEESMDEQGTIGLWITSVITMPILALFILCVATIYLSRKIGNILNEKIKL